MTDTTKALRDCDEIRALYEGEDIDVKADVLAVCDALEEYDRQLLQARNDLADAALASSSPQQETPEPKR